ncbi:MAG: Smr/MutS family protein [Rhodobacteraceae bacterium]|nr:Smr/MutS family protein [Paracoccaceae bacterium]
MPDFTDGRGLTPGEQQDWQRLVGKKPKPEAVKPTSVRTEPSAKRRVEADELLDWDTWLETGKLPEAEAKQPPPAGKTGTAHQRATRNEQNKPKGPNWNLDRKEERRLRSGQLDPDRKLDLHGMTRAGAEAALHRFFAESIHAECRLLLIVTGKGLRTTTDSGMPATGVLKQMLPFWLRSGPFAERIRYSCEAHRSHGGSGARYVMLRRKISRGHRRQD